MTKEAINTFENNKIEIIKARQQRKTRGIKNLQNPQIPVLCHIKIMGFPDKTAL